MKVIEKWRAIIAEKPDEPIIVNQWLARSALDIIGQGNAYRSPLRINTGAYGMTAAFDYNFNSLDDLTNPLAKQYSTLR